MDFKERENKIRSLGDKNWYWVSQAILRRFGRILKSSGIGVYSVLAAHANYKSQTCFPNQKTIADRIGLSRRSVNRKVRMLKKLNLVRVKRLQGRCVYFLLKPDAPKGIQQMRQKRYKGYATSGVYNNNKLTIINNKNNGTDGFNNLKPIRQLLKRYDKRSQENIGN